MSYATFELRIKRRFGNGAIFMQEDGKHIAQIDDVIISGNIFSNRVTVSWGSGHMAMASL